MKIFSLESQILAGVISSAYGNSKLRYNDAMEGKAEIFVGLPRWFWMQQYVEEAVQATYPKSWQKWIGRKSGQLPKLGEKLNRPFNRCGTDQA